MSKKKDKPRMSVLHEYEFSPMARATSTPTKQEKRRKLDRQAKQKGYQE